MKLVQLRSEGNRWAFTGRIPMELAGKTWDTREAASKAAERAGYTCLPTGEVVEAEEVPQ